MISTKVHKEQAVMIVHTLGPKGTNCEKAGLLWLKNKGVRGEVRLYETLEEALLHVKSTENSVLLGCAVYPFLHQIVFENCDAYIQHGVCRKTAHDGIGYSNRRFTPCSGSSGKAVQQSSPICHQQCSSGPGLRFKRG